MVEILKSFEIILNASAVPENEMVVDVKAWEKSAGEEITGELGGVVSGCGWLLFCWVAGALPPPNPG